MKPTLTLSLAGLIALATALLTGCPPFADLQADFTYSPRDALTGDTVQFQNTSSGRPAQYRWDFADGSPISNESSPAHVFEAAGSYGVRLTITNREGATDTFRETLVVHEYSSPQADFEADKTLGIPPFKVTFTDLSVAGFSPIATWNWDFGDGSVSDQSGTVNHTYSVTAGRVEYNVKLTVTDEKGASHTRTMNKYITTENPIESVKIDAGAFQMGIPEDLQRLLTPDQDLLVGDETNRHDVQLSAYYIAKYETTTAQFVRVLNFAKGKGYLVYKNPTLVLNADSQAVLFGLEQDTSPIKLENDLFVAKSRLDGDSQTVDLANYPVVEVTWEGAAMFCNWLSEMFGLDPCYNTAFKLIEPVPNGYRLPTEAEWERAAGWDPSKEGIILSNMETGYLWDYGVSSETLDGTQANILGANPLAFTSPPFLTPVGYYSKSQAGAPTGLLSPAGCADMSGNAEEWVYDGYTASYIAPDFITIDPTGPNRATSHVRRGGGYDDVAFDCRTTARAGGPDGESVVYAPNVGFRVARSATE